jgi:carbamoyl-phosphate synthase large subunit
MPKRSDIKSILIIGSGPIVIGQACEFDYSGTQALRALKEEGYRTILVNSNPATIMTDPEYSDSTYIEPITVESVRKIIEKERPDAILPTMGGQTALNLAMNLDKAGILKEFNIELIGARVESIRKAEDRDLFKEAMKKIGVPVPQSQVVNNLDDAKKVMARIGLPVIIRPSFTLGGSGASFAYNQQEFETLALVGLEASPVSEILIEESILNWKEYELEMMRDKNDNVVVVCSIENLDPVGVHTGDSITVAPAQTLSDREYQKLRDYSIQIMREIGVDSGGSNIQYAVHPDDGRVFVIEMNPRVSRSSALASKATGYPIAKLAAKLAVGYTLDELSNDITRVTKASFEPSIDYVVTKIPRFDFSKFKNTKPHLGPQMKAVGEVMAIGRTFVESFQKALSSLENNIHGFWVKIPSLMSDDELLGYLRTPTASRIMYLGEALRRNIDLEAIYKVTAIDRWFLYELKKITDEENALKGSSLKKLDEDELKRIKGMGFSDRRLSELLDCDVKDVEKARQKMGVIPTYKIVDTCAAEFESFTNYMYSTYEDESEAEPTKNKKVVILGSGPNRIGQGVEFDYCCVHASIALQKLGYESIIINCNPETVSTDYDISNRLYFEPLTREYVLNILHREKPDGVIVQFGGQTPLKLSQDIQDAGFKILGTSTDSIWMAEDRKRFSKFLDDLKIQQPESRIIYSAEEADTVAKELPFPLMVRPSFVLGGRAMEIVEHAEDLKNYLERAVKVSASQPVLIDRYLENSIEIDVDAMCDGKNTYIAGIMQHVEQAGVHSGDSSCVLPPFSISIETQKKIEEQTKKIATALNVKGFLNIQFALQKDELFVLEVNPRASRTVPFVSKATAIPLVFEALKVLLGESLNVTELNQRKKSSLYSVKSPVFPFLKFSNEDTILGPEMKSTGEVMGIDQRWEVAFGKAQVAAGNLLPLKGRVFISVKDSDKIASLEVARQMKKNGFDIVSTQGTAVFYQSHGIDVQPVNKVREGRPHIVDSILNHEIQLVMNTTRNRQSVRDSYSIRRTTLEKAIPYFTTIEGAKAAAFSIALQLESAPQPVRLQTLSE